MMLITINDEQQFLVQDCIVVLVEKNRVTVVNGNKVTILDDKDIAIEKCHDEFTVSTWPAGAICSGLDLLYAYGIH